MNEKKTTGMSEEPKMYRILSLDGGGSWALLQLLTLRERFKDQIPELRGHDILREFDLVIANSGGSIVLAALAENKTLDEAIGLFDQKDKRDLIFHRNSFRDTFFPVWLTRRFGFGPKYSSVQKGHAFSSLLPEIDKVTMDRLPAMIGKEDLKLIVCTYDALNNRAKFFRSYSTGNDGEFAQLTKVVNGSSNAPIQYFDFPVRFKASGSGIFYELWDGALGGFNNPVVAGIIEAFNLGISLDQMQVVSLGNTNRLMSVEDKQAFYQMTHITQTERRRKWRLWRYGFQLRYFKTTVLNQAKTILYHPPDWANYVAFMFLSKTATNGPGNRFLRLSPLLHVDSNTPASDRAFIDQLYKMDMDLTSDEDINRVKQCFDWWCKGRILNQPIQFNVARNNDVQYIVGDKYFADAMAKWK